MKKKTKINFLFFFGAIFLFTVFIEIIMQIIAPPRLIKVGTVRAPKADLYGWAPMPNSHGIFENPDTGEKSKFTTNSQGWRDVEHSFGKPKDITRILFLGDSNTWGYVPLNKLYTRQVEYLLKKRGFKNIEVISIGLCGWGTDLALEALQREGIRYNPDIVIYQFCDNDIVDNLQPIENYKYGDPGFGKLFKYELDKGILKKIKLRCSPVAVPLFKKMLLKSALIYNINKLKNNSVDAFLSITHLNNKSPIDPFFTIYYDGSVGENENIIKGWKLFEELIKKMKLICFENNAEFIVFAQTGDDGGVYWNTKWGGVKSDGGKNFVLYNGKEYFVDFRRPLIDLIEVSKRNNILLINPTRPYNRYKYDPHPNEIGNKNMALDIVNFLINHMSIFKNNA